MFANALFFDRWNLGTSDVYVRDDAEVDATGRYIYPAGVPTAGKAVMCTPLRAYYIYQ